MASRKPVTSAGVGNAVWPSVVSDIDFMVRECLALGRDEAARRIAVAVETAVSEARWQDAVDWQRVRLRAKRSGLDLPEPGIVGIIMPAPERPGRSRI